MDGQGLGFGAQQLEEVPFGIGEMFYSRTDPRGVILAGNAVFQRVSGYSWSELIGAPHRVIRNPVTPRAVFRILWTAIETGEPAVAYVCNRAADGRPYWVLATVLPFGNGYLSIRLKPSSTLFPVVKALYAELSAAEVAGRSIEDSVAALGAALRERGFADYAAFMRAAVSAEYLARNAATGAASALADATIQAIRQGLADAMAGQQRLKSDFEGMKILPTNLSILAARLEPEGGPLSAVAGLYMTSTLETLAQIGAFTSGEASLCNRMSERFERAIFMVTCAALQREMAAIVPQEDWTGTGLDPAAEAQHLGLLGQSYDEAAMKAIGEACELSQAIERAGQELRRAILSLETVTVMGKVEGSRLGAEGERIRMTIHSLHLINEEISGVLNRISALSATIEQGMAEISDGFRKRLVGRRTGPR